MKRIQTIALNDLELYAYHGYYKEERIIGGWFNVNISVEVDFSIAANNDQLTYTLNYELLFSIVKEEMNVSSKLLEHVAGRIEKRIINLKQPVQKLSIGIEKLNPPFPARIRSSEVKIEINFN